LETIHLEKHLKSFVGENMKPVIDFLQPAHLGRPYPFKTGLIAMFVFFVSLAGMESASALPSLPLLPAVPSNPLLQPQQNLYVESRINPPLSLQLLNLMANGSVGAEGPGSSRWVFSLEAPLTYDTNPGLTGGSPSPAWEVDPQFELLHSGPAARDLLLTEIIGADTALYPGNPGYNLNTLSGELQVNFTDKGINFESAPFVAYKSSFTVPANFSGHAWVSDIEVGYNFNRVLGTGGEETSRKGKDLGTDPFEMDFNPGLSQRWIQIDDGMGNSSSSGSSALEIEVPLIYRLTPRLQLILDFTAYTRYYNVEQSPENENRVDESLSFPLSLGWTLVPAWGLKVAAEGSCSQEFSSVSGQDVLQVNTGGNLEASF
jgi:hypothetical protein